jgi:SAM-dependent methyltransferase
MAINNYYQENSAYLESNPSWHIEDSPWKAKQILKMIKKNSLQINSIAEIGCGAGEILNRLQTSLPKNVLFTGFDISPDAIKMAQKRKSQRVSFRQEDMIKSREFFDLLLMIDVFEHVEDYMGFLRACKDKSEYKLFHIPLDASMFMIFRNKLLTMRKSVGHLHYFMKDTALATLSDTGYEIVDHFYTSIILDIPRKSIKSKMGYMPRRLLSLMSEDFAAKTIGGFSLMVLAK